MIMDDNAEIFRGFGAPDPWYMCMYTVSGWWLSPTPLKNMSLSIRMMTSPIYGKMKHVPVTTKQV